MIRRWSLGTLLLGAAWLAAVQSRAAQSDFLAPLKTQWDNTRTLVEGLVAQVPEDMYDFRPTPEVRSFREQFTHLIGENFRNMNHYGNLVVYVRLNGMVPGRTAGQQQRQQPPPQTQR